MTQPEMIVDRPLPQLNALTEPFFRAAREHRLLIQRCTACRGHQFPPELTCTLCGHDGVEWVEASGRATLYTWTLAHPPLLPAFAQSPPWAVVAVELEEGPRMVTRLLDVPVPDYRFDLALRVDFEDVDDEIALVVFRREGARG